MKSQNQTKIIQFEDKWCYWLKEVGIIVCISKLGSLIDLWLFKEVGILTPSWQTKVKLGHVRENWFMFALIIHYTTQVLSILFPQGN